MEPRSSIAFICDLEDAFRGTDTGLHSLRARQIVPAPTPSFCFD